VERIAREHGPGRGMMATRGSAPKFPLRLDRLGPSSKDSGVGARAMLRPQAPLQQAAADEARRVVPSGLGLDSAEVRRRMAVRLRTAGLRNEAVLEALAFHTCAALEEAEMTFQPLLPDDAEPLVQRVDGLAQWCQGFNHGLFVAARIGDAEAELSSGNTAEIVRDFGDLAQVAVGDEEPDAEGEAAYVELVEYIRVSVQLVYEELTAVRQRVQSAGRH